MITLDGEQEEPDVLACVFAEAQGSVATVVPREELRARVQDRLATGALGFMTFQHRGATVGLRGITRALSEHALQFAVVDGVELAERRIATRIPLAVEVRAAPEAGGEAAPIQTVTANLSMTGALLERQPDIGRGPWQIELFLPGESTPVSCTAVLRRETRSHFGVAFTELTEFDRARLRRAIIAGPAAASRLPLSRPATCPGPRAAPVPRRRHQL